MDLQEQIGLIAGLLGALLVELLGEKHGWALIRAWALNRDNTVHIKWVTLLLVDQVVRTKCFRFALNLMIKHY